MSTEQFREALEASIRKKGLVNDLKAELRARIFHLLKDKIPLEKTSTYTASRLIVQVIDNLILEYLEKQHYDCTLSVFLSESGLNETQRLTTKDMLHILNLNYSEELRAILKNSQDGLLMAILSGMAVIDNDLSLIENMKKDIDVNIDPKYRSILEPPPTSTLHFQVNKDESDMSQLPSEITERSQENLETDAETRNLKKQLLNIMRLASKQKEEIKSYKEKLHKVETKQETSELRRKYEQTVKENRKLSAKVENEIHAKSKLIKALEEEKYQSSTLENELKRIQGILSKTQKVLSPLVLENNSDLDSLMAELKNASFFIDTYTERTGTPNISLVYDEYHAPNET
ncbi:hypothetical protein K7432_002553 [Basidiobolus ranarum]|uniref:LisH domain-containing protein n=1 Tax=Basidiobolus ranarum TaxID=34480 RepID=A0ABR2W7K6_9FUNG